jgi:competence protein ComEA
MKPWKRIFALMVAIAMVTALVPLAPAEEGQRVNINKAGVEELMQLQKIGKSYAERIVAYREKNGPFEKPEDIMKVKGIGARTFELNQDRISVE